jgi:hypothetical protein
MNSARKASRPSASRTHKADSSFALGPCRITPRR